MTAENREKPAHTSAPPDALGRSLERLANDLLILTKVSSVYPKGHPGVLQVTQRLCDWSSTEHLEEVSLGFAPTRLLFRERFFGSPGSRCEALAALFHGRKIMRMTWAEQLGIEDVKTLAFLLARSRLTGSDLRGALRDAGVYTIDLDPLEAQRIHVALFPDSPATPSREETLQRGLEAWLWIQDESLRPEGLAEALASEGFWSLGETDPMATVQLVLRQLGKLPEALRTLAEPDRERVKDRLARLRKALTLAELAGVVVAAGSAPQHAEGAALLLDDLTPETVIDLMAEAVAAEGRTTPRIDALFRRLAPKCGTADMLALVEARLASDSGRTYALDVWRTVKAFLLESSDEQFVDDDYGADLDAMSGAEAGARPPVDPLQEDSEAHVDGIAFDLARAGTDQGVLRLRRRLAARLDVAPVQHLLSLASAADREVPAVFDGQTDLVRGLFSRVLSATRQLDNSARQTAIDFARSHEAAVLDETITSLVRERRITVRRFLVEVLGSLSPETTPRLLERAGSAPWYYLRNVATVLGQRKERENAPVLEALLGHPHEMVRKEALKGLSRMGGAAIRVVECFASDPSRQPDERQLAKSLLARRSKAIGQRPAGKVPARPGPAVPDPPDVPPGS